MDEKCPKCNMPMADCQCPKDGDMPKEGMDTDMGMEKKEEEMEGEGE